MKSIRLLLIITILGMLLPVRLRAGDVYIDNLTSPQVSDMFRYGNVETSLFTGKLNFSIPIYSLDDSDFDLNIALRYNSEGFKPTKQSGYVGHSWFLEAGGCITREVKNFPDEFQRQDAFNSFQYKGMLTFTREKQLDVSKVFNLDPSVVYEVDANNHIYSLDADYTIDVDYLPDVFRFNFCGHHGSFIINNQGKVVILDGDFVTVDLSRLTDCSTNSGMDFTPPSSSQITLKTTDGYVYVFGGSLSAIEYTLVVNKDSKAFPQQQAPHVNTWHLSKVIAPNGRTITYHYKPMIESPSSDYDPLLSFCEYYDNFAGSLNHDISNYDAKLRQIVTKECILDSIIVRGNTSLKIEFCNHVDSHRLHPYNMCPYNYMLDTIRVTANERVIRLAELKSIYKNSINAQGSPYNYWRFLSSVSIQGIGEYTLNYNHQGTYPFIGITDANYTDDISSFGYYNNYPMLGLLTEVVYPTGGRQQFSYGLHQCAVERCYMAEQGGNVRITEKTNFNLPNGRGVRIEQIKSYLDNTLIETKTYSYNKKNSTTSSGIYYNTSVTYRLGSVVYGETIKNAFSYSFFDSHIGYSTVKETTTYAANNETNEIIYSFYTGINSYNSQEDDINRINETTLDSDNTAAILSGMLVYDSRLSPNGQLLSIEYYKNGAPIRTKQFKYNGISSSTDLIQTNRYPSLGYTDTIVVFANHFMPITRKLFVCPPVLQEEITKDFLSGNQNIYNSRCILHDAKLRTKQEWITNSDGVTYFTKYTYPNDLSLPANAENIPSLRPYYLLEMVHRIAEPIEVVSGYVENNQEKVMGGKVNLFRVNESSNTNPFPRFASLDPLFPQPLFPQPSLHETLELHIPKAITDYQFVTILGDSLHYDNRYSPICTYNFDGLLRLQEITPIDKIKTTYTWNFFYPASQTKGNQTTTYGFLPYIGMSSITDIRGLQTCYEYTDIVGRLSSTYLFNNDKKEIINSYIYNQAYSSNSACRKDVIALESLPILKQVLGQPAPRLLTTMNYYDGFGRPYETVALGQSPTGNDIVTMTGYTGLERVTHQWLPIVDATNSEPLSISAYTNKATTFYNDNRPYQETRYEASALNRAVGSVRAGVDYESHPSGQTYEINTLNDAVRKFSVVYEELTNGSIETKLQCSNNYDRFTLYKNTISDEDGKSITTFTDLFGRKILERQDGNDTYYVYDHKGQLCYVLPPLAANQITNGTYSDTTDVLKKYAYVYKYDSRGNQIYKRLPGCEPTFMVYDITNTLVMSQTGTQRQRGTYWTVYKCDALRRVVYTSEVNIGHADYNYLWNNWDTLYIKESFSLTPQANMMTNTGYTRSFYHIHPTTLLTVNYYDTYEFLDLMADSVRNHMTFAAFDDNATYANAKGLLTGTRTYYMDGSGDYSETVYYYDYRGREIQRRSTNHLGGYDVLSTKYDFVSNITDTWSNQSTNNGLTTTEHYQYTYDHANRPLTTTYTFNNESPIVLQSYHYDELGRVRSRHLHGGIDSVTFAYNIRDQITQIKSSGYEQKYYYNQVCPIGSEYIQTVYNGNVSATTWTYGNKINGYMYYYDNANRLQSTYSIFNEGFGENYYAENFAYDSHGNITQLARYDNGRLMDNMSLVYNGNQLTKVDDPNDSYSYTAKQYHDNNATGDDFAYDANGNMLYDKDRGIAAIRYNLLNLPDTIQFANGNQIVHRYDAVGNRLTTNYYTRKVTTSVPLGNTLKGTNNTTNYHITRDAYHNNIVYHADNSNQFGIKFVHNSEGFIRYDGPSEHYHFYHIKDLLGNIRETYIHPEAGYKECMERTQYYPSGLPWVERYSNSEGAHPWKYNGKEFVEMHGLDEYDSKARWYYPAICRTTTTDPLAEKYYSTSPYAWCGNNPIKHIDRNGKWIESAWDAANVVIGVNSLITNIQEHNIQDAVIDGAGLILDVAAVILPVVPGGVSTAIKTARVANNVSDVVNVTTRTATKHNYRKVLQETTGKVGKGYEAHHTLPQKYRKQFEALDINIDEPGNVVWRKKENHRKQNYQHTKAWDKEYEDLPNKSKDDVYKLRDQIENEIFENLGDTPSE